MKLFIKQPIYIICLLFTVLSACTGKKQEQAKSEEHHEVTNSDYVILSEEQFKTVKLKLGRFSEKNLSTMVKASGMLDLPPQNKASISTLIGGRISSIKVIQGQFVDKGQTLAVIENPEIIKMQQEYLEAESRFRYAEKEFLRQKELYAEKIVSGKKFEAAETDFESQKALKRSLENQLKQIGISPSQISKGELKTSVDLTSPIHGWIHKINVNTGSFVNPASEIFVVVDNHHVHIDLNVFENDVPKVKEGQKVYFTLNNAPGERYEAKIFSVGKAFDTETRSVSIHAEITDNKNRNLLPGMYVDGRIEVDTSKVKALPEAAVVSEGNLNYIFVQVKDSAAREKNADSVHKETDGIHTESEGLKFRKVQIKTGASDQGFTEVKPVEEIPAGAEIVVDGAYYLDAQMKKGEGGGEH
jgi:membrane fusion protein, heavy metal efflux system